MNFKDLIVELLPENCEVSLEEVDTLWRNGLLLHLVVLNHHHNIPQPKDLEFIDLSTSWPWRPGTPLTEREKKLRGTPAKGDFKVECFPRVLAKFNLHHPDTIDGLREILFEECYGCEVEVKYARGS
jgi:hypothetical protein